MIKLDRRLITGIRDAQSGPDLYFYLGQAVKLEHSTIPPYLTALFSLKPGTNQAIAQRIHSIVVEEMLHMTIASNVLIAIGGNPQINTKDFVPEYPGSLPLQIGHDLQVGIEAFSIPLVEKVFMGIEEPEHPVPVHTAVSLGAEAVPEFATIGEFYDAIQTQIRALGPSIFTHTTAPPQVVSNEWFPPEKLFPITGVDSACHAIDIIKLEGEGTSTTPFESPGDPAHFYKFGEIAAGRELIQTPAGFAYAGPPIPFDTAGVWPLRANCKIGQFAEGTQARTRIERFAYSYSALLNALHETFNGYPEKLNAAIGMMYDLRVFAVALMQTEIGDGSGQTVGPSFEFVNVQGGMS
ncbi:MAG: ferritin-like protein [Bryobacterales bacterium]|nr:ferritin-like protein [Bryobacterales bacterium]